MADPSESTQYDDSNSEALFYRTCLNPESDEWLSCDSHGTSQGSPEAAYYAYLKLKQMHSTP